MGSKGGGDINQVTRDEPRHGMPVSGVRLTVHLKCIYTNAHSMGNKEEELEAVTQQDSYDLIAITATWWDDSHDWRIATDSYKRFRRDRQGKRGGGVALC